MTYRPNSLRYFALGLDPIHVGTGGMHLGRVDMSIVREPGTNLPKIPGSSLAGACRTYATMQVPEKWPQCAGQGQVQGNYQGHCGKNDCPICVTFGFAKGEGGSFQGLAQFSDARLVFFPVHSLAGPVWATCPRILQELNAWPHNQVSSIEDKLHVAKSVTTSKRLNLGWLILDVADSNFALDAGKLPGVPQEILDHAVLVSDKMFGHIVNDNLEVRTSVSIDPQTGAAAEGALYSYEALPRASLLTFDVVVSHPKYYRMAVQVTKNGKTETIHRIPLSYNKHPEGDQELVMKTVQNGLALFDTLGVGGMNTRGMGRMKVLSLDPGGEQ
jgi:CRISPR-associated protein Cmr4